MGMLPPKNHSECAIVFLVINRIESLPILAINSVLANSDSPIFIGTIRAIDRENLPTDDRINYVDLSEDAARLGIPITKGVYESFEKDEFFSLVQLKWALFKKVSEISKCEIMVYNDIDVFWLRPLLPALTNAFAISSKVQVMIQHFSWTPGQPQLCMGFVAFRLGNYFDNLIERAAELHTQMLETNPRSGDDDVITRLYTSEEFPQEIQLLPQTTFPVGNLLNLFSKRDEFPGLRPFDPFIFHSNFVVGLRKKLLITKIAYRQHGLKLTGINSFASTLMSLEIMSYRMFHLLRRRLKHR
jgi:hypothetical protein